MANNFAWCDPITIITFFLLVLLFLVDGIESDTDNRLIVVSKQVIAN